MTPYDVEVQSDVETSEAVIDRLRAAAVTTLERQEVPQQTGLTLLLTAAERVRELKRPYRGVDRATDVLSFPFGEPLPDGGQYLGDVAIAVPVARAQAAAAGHSLEAELVLLAVHGILHLLGYDHAQAGEKARMWAAQAQLLEQLGVEAAPTEE
jgi:probable rRNA maturation factor